MMVKRKGSTTSRGKKLIEERFDVYVLFSVLFNVWCFVCFFVRVVLNDCFCSKCCLFVEFWFSL